MFSTIAALVLFLSSDSNKKAYCELKNHKSNDNNNYYFYVIAAVSISILIHYS